MHYATPKAILSTTNGMNLCRGCLHGCIYCDARSKCYHMEHDFEDIEIKQNAPILLESTIRRKRHACMIGTGGMSDPYIPLKESLEITRQCLQIIDRYEFGVTLHTKSNLILRDIDLLESINKKSKCVVQMTLTTKDDDLCKLIEPNVCTTSQRVEVLREMKKRNIPTVVWLTPLLPFINDTNENVLGILEDCIDVGVHGIITFGMGLTLREGNREYFYEQLDKHFPGLKQKYIKTYGLAYELPSPNQKDLLKLFYSTCHSNHILCNDDKIFEYLHEYHRNEGTQLSLFDFMKL